MTDTRKIVFLDLVTQHVQLEDELVEMFRTSLRTASFVGGPMVEGFEREFANFCEAKHCIGVSSGTDAVRFALMAAGVRVGDSVVTVPHTFIATTEAISQAGAVPEFVDIDEQTYTMDPEKLRYFLEKDCTLDVATGRRVSRRTGRPVSAVVPVHIYGHTADMDAINLLAEKYKLAVIEDACQAHGAQYFSQREKTWKKAGSLGVAAAFSFYPGKNLGACGEAGAVTTNDEKMAQTIRMLRDHGQAKKYYHLVEGYNGRLDAIQAGILRTKLAHLADWNEKRREAASRYREVFAAAGSEEVTLPYEAPWTRAVYHLYVIRTKNRDQLRSYLAEMGIDTGIHYPIPLHLQDAYKGLGYGNGDFPVTESVAKEIVSLPMFPTLDAEQQRRVASGVMNFVSMAVV
jgi:dTDP-4-amino-4,6-dideoxygalactose transaminase